MLGIAILHLIPHGVATSGSIDLVMGACLVGLLVTFFLIRLFHFHQHGEVAEEGTGGHGIGCGHTDHRTHDHPSHGEPSLGHLAHGHHAPHEHSLDQEKMGAGPHPYGWTGMAFGLALHTLFDGIALGSAMLADATHPSPPLLLGLGVFAAIWLHKWLDALSISSLMLASGWPAALRNLVNLSFALMCPLGAVLVVFGLARFDADQQRMLGMATGFSAGVFLCISLGDLLPELQFHRHDRIKLSLALLAGVALAYGLGFLEPAHRH